MVVISSKLVLAHQSQEDIKNLYNLINACLATQIEGFIAKLKE